MYCLGHAVCHCQYASAVHFEKLKTKYCLDKDIVVDYTVEDKTRTTMRDWIGIFPRGWINLQQYLTFEYVVVSPKTSVLPNRSLVFLRTFHREASPNIDYQFVYVSKEMEILGSSSYFRFVVPPHPRSFDRNESTPRPGLARNVHYHPPAVDASAMKNAGKTIASSKSHDNIVRSGRFERPFMDPRTCRVCSASTSFAANRVQFLLLHNEQLVARLGRLARDLELTERGLEIERMEQAMLTKRLKAYEAFVADMYKYLNLTGVVKIVDEDATEIIVQKIKSSQMSTMCNGQSDKFVPILEHPTMEDCARSRKSHDEETANKNGTTTEASLVPEKASCSFWRQRKMSRENESNGDTKLAVKGEELTSRGKENIFDDVRAEDERSFEACKTIRLSSAEIADRRHENPRGSCVTKETGDATDQGEDNTCGVSCKIEQVQANRVEGESGCKAKKSADNRGDKEDPLEMADSPRCCHCDCHSRGQDAPAEWTLECECDLDVSDGVYEMINNSLGQHSVKVHDVLLSRETFEGGINNSVPVPRTKPSAVLIRARNAKYSIVRY